MHTLQTFGAGLAVITIGLIASLIVGHYLAWHKHKSSYGEKIFVGFMSILTVSGCLLFVLLLTYALGEAAMAIFHK